MDNNELTLALTIVGAIFVAVVLILITGLVLFFRYMSSTEPVEVGSWGRKPIAKQTPQIQEMPIRDHDW